MMSLVSVVLLLAAVPVASASSIFLLEICAAILASKQDLSVPTTIRRPPVVVVIPAHDESCGILPTLKDVKDQLQPDDRLLVVADNCTDDTAAVAAAAFAEVVERFNDNERGKGYALDFGIRSLHEDDPSIVLIIDADCRLEPGAIDQLTRTCCATDRPVQALYLMNAPERAAVSHRIAEFAWRIKNDLRPRGLRGLGLPCQLMGSGMAFPRNALAAVEVASGHLAEDLELGLQLARAGYAPLFCPGAVVRSVFPTSEAASVTQQQRWEHGHLAIVGRKVLPSLGVAVRDRNWRLFLLSLDAGVPPLALLAGLSTAMVLLSLLGWWEGTGRAPVVVSLAGLGSLALALGLAWTARGRDLLTRATLSSLAPFLKRKAGVYARAFASNKTWTRTGRGGTS
jgi:cellulose synthase/poly-beta-1,6-N-acetylglucosamine synthase-like glycosyltransferase